MTDLSSRYFTLSSRYFKIDFKLQMLDTKADYVYISAVESNISRRHKKIFCSQVRAATVFALGTFISRSPDRTDHSVAVDVQVGNLLVTCITDGSPLVRKVSLSVMVSPTVLGMVEMAETASVEKK